jgi:transposase-like protein
MPWRRNEVLEERVRSVLTYLEGEDSVAELCRAFGISRRTGYKFLPGAPGALSMS